MKTRPSAMAADDLTSSPVLNFQRNWRESAQIPFRAAQKALAAMKHGPTGGEQRTEIGGRRTEVR